MFIDDPVILQELCDRGNKTAAEHCLILKTEANKGEPLLYALRQAFTNLDVEIKETEW